MLTNWCDDFKELLKFDGIKFIVQRFFHKRCGFRKTLKKCGDFFPFARTEIPFQNMLIDQC